MYNKLFQKILDSTIWSKPHGTRLVWITFLAAMDEDGFASFGDTEALAHRARVTSKEAHAAVATLQSAEPSSAIEGDDGRRIERVPGGWMVLNAAKYREIVSRQIARENTRARVAKHRLNRRATDPCNAGVTPSEAEAEADTEVREETTAASRPDPFDEFKRAYPKRAGNQPWGRALKAWNARVLQGHTAKEFIDGAARYALWARATGKEGTELVLQAATFLGPDKPFLEPWVIPEPKANGAAQAEAAWDRVMSHCKNGAYRKGPLGDNAIDAAVKTLGGYQSIAMVNTGSLPFLKRQFATALREARP